MIQHHLRDSRRQVGSCGTTLPRTLPATRWTDLWRALLCAALLFQSILVQSHVHEEPGVARTAASFEQVASGTGETLSKGTPTGAADYCLLCWEAAMAGQYVAPPAAFALPVAPPMVWGGLVALAEWALRQPPRGWFGRAPPQ